MQNGVTACILSWNNLNVVKDTIRRLRREADVLVVDNGSTDGSRLYFADLKGKIDYLQLGENKGASVARNVALGRVSADRFFLIDGDILYVPETIRHLNKIMDKYGDCGCVGVHDPERVELMGLNGTLNPLEADTCAEAPDKVYKGLPMAWTQFGLFRNIGVRFPEDPPFDKAGYGLEDSWFYQEMKQKGFESYFITRPLYYHDAHSGKRELEKAGLSTHEQERRAAFVARFGEVDWLERKFKIEEVC